MQKQIQLGNIDNSRYKYSDDYSRNFYDFVGEQLKKGVTDEDSRLDSGKLVSR